MLNTNSDPHHEDKQKKEPSSQTSGGTSYLPAMSIQAHRNREALRYPNWQMPVGRRR
jgi:hypothetical protein